VSDAEPQGFLFVPSGAPMLDNKTQRRPARFETAVFERAELVDLGNGQDVAPITQAFAVSQQN
jgi:hypothetical protein